MMSKLWNGGFGQRETLIKSPRQALTSSISIFMYKMGVKIFLKADKTLGVILVIVSLYGEKFVCFDASTGSVWKLGTSLI